MSWLRGFEAFVREGVPLAPLTTYRASAGRPSIFAAPPTSRACAHCWRARMEQAARRSLMKAMERICWCRADARRQRAWL